MHAPSQLLLCRGAARCAIAYPLALAGGVGVMHVNSCVYVAHFALACCVVDACCCSMHMRPAAVFLNGTMCFSRANQLKHDVLSMRATGNNIGSMSWRPHGLLAVRQPRVPSSTCASSASPTRAMPTAIVLTGPICGSCPLGREWENALCMPARHTVGRGRVRRLHVVGCVCVCG